MRRKKIDPRRTPEEATRDRIRRDYASSRHGEFVHDYGVGAMWLGLARRWRRPVQEIKRICRPGSYSDEATEAPNITRQPVLREPHTARRAPMPVAGHRGAAA